MREFKFRAFNKDKKIMVYKNEDKSSTFWGGVRCSNIEMVNNRFESDEYIWMQYTGLKDSEGKEIYEGDIIEYGHHKDLQRRKIESARGCFGVYDSEYSFYTFLGNSLGLSAFRPKIIGNIYENPELLNK